jgi:hypothetical protein
MDDNQYSDAAYEAHAQERLRSLALHAGIVFGMFFAYCAGWASALIILK